MTLLSFFLNLFSFKNRYLKSVVYREQKLKIGVLTSIFLCVMYILEWEFFMDEKLEILKEKYNLNERILDLTIDVAFKKVFAAKENRWYLVFLISYCTKLDINYILKNMKMKNDFISSSNIKMKTGYSDILVEVDKKIINIEMNRNLSEKLIRKNKWYVNTLSSVSAEKNSKLDKLIIQINISTKARISKTNELLYEIVKMDKNLKVEDVYNK